MFVNKRIMIFLQEKYMSIIAAGINYRIAMKGIMEYEKYYTRYRFSIVL